MKNPAKIRELAGERLNEAEILYDNKKYDGAFYLAGYSVELMLKAKVCEHFGIDNLFDKEGCAVQGISDLRKVVHTHDIRLLLLFSGLEAKFQTDKVKNPKLMQTYGFFTASTGNKKDWSEQVRYQPKGSQSEQNVKDFIDLLKDKNGLLEWISNN